MTSLIIVGAGVLGALGFVIAGLRHLVLAAFALEKRTHFLEERAIYAQFAAIGGRIDTVSREIESLPELWERGRRALVAIERTRTRVRTAVRGVGFAARMARAVWEGPKRG